MRDAARGGRERDDRGRGVKVERRGGGRDHSSIPPTVIHTDDLSGGERDGKGGAVATRGRSVDRAGDDAFWCYGERLHGANGDFICRAGYVFVGVLCEQGGLTRTIGCCRW